MTDYERLCRDDPHAATELRAEALRNHAEVQAFLRTERALNPELAWRGTSAGREWMKLDAQRLIAAAGLAPGELAAQMNADIRRRLAGETPVEREQRLAHISEARARRRERELDREALRDAQRRRPMAA